jgi:hypothetical protein
VADAIIKANVGFDASNVRVLWKGLFRWMELGYPTAP